MWRAFGMGVWIGVIIGLCICASSWGTAMEMGRREMRRKMLRHWRREFESTVKCEARLRTKAAALEDDNRMLWEANCYWRARHQAKRLMGR